MSLLKEFLQALFSLGRTKNKGVPDDGYELHETTEMPLSPDIMPEEQDRPKPIVQHFVKETESAENFAATQPLVFDEESNSVCPHMQHPATEQVQVQATDEKRINEQGISEDCSKLLQNVCDAIDVLDDRQSDFATIPGDQVWKYVRARLIDKLNRSGATLIKDEKSLDWIRHKPLETTLMPNDGHPIEKTVAPGICIGEEVYLRAVVKLEEE